MKVVIAGSRGMIVPQNILKQIISFCNINITEIISGGCPNSPDEAGEQFAKENNIPLRVFYADWQTHGGMAGPLRNREMAQQADMGLVFWDGKSTGTKNMKDNLHRHKKQVAVVNCVDTVVDDKYIETAYIIGNTAFTHQFTFEEKKKEPTNGKQDSTAN